MARVEHNTSPMVALGMIAGLAIVLALTWGVVRFVFRIPSLVSLAAEARRRERGYAALSRGMVAVSSATARGEPSRRRSARALSDDRWPNCCARRRRNSRRSRGRRRRVP